jgi:hypothetical protein
MLQGKRSLHSKPLARLSRVTSVTLGQRAEAQRKGLFVRFMAALHESRQCEAHRVIRRYQSLVDASDD